jgi:hypothetical protein
MADLLTTFANAYRYNPNSAYESAQNMQNMMANALDYQQKREALEAQRNIKELYAQNPQPGFEDIARIDPAFAMQQQIANMNMREKMLKSEKTQGEISEQHKTAFARTAAPIAEKYAGMQMNPQTMAQFHNEMGGALAQFEQQTGIKPPPGFNVEVLSPDSVLMWAAPYYQSPTMANRAAVERQAALNQLPPQMTPNQAFGYYNPTEYGMQRVPGMGGMSGQTGMPQGPVLRQQGVTPFAPPSVQQEAYTTEGAMPFDMQLAPMTNVAEDIAKMKAVRAQMPAGRQRDAMDKMIADLEAGNVGQPSAPPSDQFVTGQDIQRLKAEEDIRRSELRTQEEKAKIEEQTKATGERKTAELEAEKVAARQKAMDAFALIPPLPEVEKLIMQSTSGATQRAAAEAFGAATGKATPGMKNIGTLGTIAGRLRDAVNRAPGSQSDKDAIIESMKTGNIADPNVPASQRLQAYKEFVRQMRQMIKNATGIDAEETTGIETGPVRVKSAAEAQALPSGTLFMREDGSIHRRK